MKRVLSWVLILVSFLFPAVSALGAIAPPAVEKAFDASVFQEDQGFTLRADGSWIYFRGIVFSDVGGKGIQLSVQADGADPGSVSAVRLFVVVTEAGKNDVSAFGTPRRIILSLNGDTTADCHLPDRYPNPACASVSLGEEGEKLCRILTDTRSLSLEIAFEDSDQTLRYELTEPNVGVFRKSIGAICGRLTESGIFTFLPDSADDFGWINLDAAPAEDEPEPEAVPDAEPTLRPEPAPAADAAPQRKQSFRSLGPGDRVDLGLYPQSGDPDARPEPITWRVLTVDVHTRRALLLAEHGLDVLPFADPGSAGPRSGLSWENASVREWLNQVFYPEAFSGEEKQRIVETRIRTNDKTGSRLTDDRVFLLDGKEAKGFLKTAPEMACTLTDYARGRLRGASSAVTDDGSCRWWLRELIVVPQSGGGTGVSGYEAGFVNGSRGLFMFYQYAGAPVDRGVCAVRPAMWIELD